MIWKIADRAAAQKIANRTGRGLFLVRGVSGNLYASTEDITRGSSTLTNEGVADPVGMDARKNPDGGWIVPEYRKGMTIHSRRTVMFDQLITGVGEISEADIEKMVAEILAQE